MEQVLNESGAAAFLGLARQSLANMRHRRVGPPYCKLGFRVVYRLADLESYLHVRRIDPEAGREVR